MITERFNDAFSHGLTPAEWHPTSTRSVVDRFTMTTEPSPIPLTGVIQIYESDFVTSA